MSSILGCMERTVNILFYNIEAVLIVLAVLPIFLICILLNRYIFKSADMISGAING